MASTIWKGRLNFGLVSIPIKLYRAARAEKIHMHKLERQTGARVKQVFVPAAEDDEPASAAAPEEEAIPETPAPPSRPFAVRAPEFRAQDPSAPAEVPTAPPPAPKLANSDLVQGYEYEKDRYVKFEADELASLAPKSSPEMQIVEFVKFAEVDPVYLETSYYVAPDAGGDKPYSLLLEALRKTGYAAIGEFVMHRRDQIIILRPGTHGVIAHTLFYEDEVRRENEYQPEKGLVAPKEMDLAIKLVEALAGDFEPGKFKDHYRERLQQAIAEKVAGGEVTSPAKVAAKAPVVDIMAALKESLSKARKPVASEVAKAPAARKTKRAGAK